MGLKSVARIFFKRCRPAIGKYTDLTRGNIEFPCAQDCLQKRLDVILEHIFLRLLQGQRKQSWQPIKTPKTFARIRGHLAENDRELSPANKEAS